MTNEPNRTHPTDDDRKADDPRISAYLLGELDGDQRIAIERELALHPELLSLSDELRDTAAILEAGLRGEVAPALNPAQRAQIERASRPRVLDLLPSLRAVLAASILGGTSYFLAGIDPGDNTTSIATLSDDVEIMEDPDAALRNEVTGYSEDGSTSILSVGFYRGPGDVVAPNPSPPATTGPTTGGPTGPGHWGPSTPAGRSWIDSPNRGPTGPSTPRGPSGPGGGGPQSGNTGIGRLADRHAASNVVTRPRATPSTVGAVVSALSAGRPAVGNPGAVPALQLRFEVGPAKNFNLSPGGFTDLDFGDELLGENYHAPPENPFVLTGEDPMSTFSIDVDTASYTNARRYLMSGTLPPPDSVRMEEFINYFRYEDPPPVGDIPFSVATEVAACPWQPRHQLIRVGLKGKDIQWSQRPASNLVFLIDVSGSMQSADKLPLLVRSMKLLVEQLDSRDSVAIVVYAGASGLVLPATQGNQHVDIMNALDKLAAGGSTNGGAGIELAYQVAADRFIAGGLNRVILATDGDFNVGVSSRDDLVKLIEAKRETGVFLSVFGFGSGNLNDHGMEQLADKGNGAYSYIDTLDEGRRVLVEEIGGTMMAIAKDVKIQVAFNPSAVRAWRLLGYENRLLNHQDFNDDTKDAGEIGAGATCTAIYEVVPVTQPLPAGMASRPISTFELPSMAQNMPYDELMLLRLRYKDPSGDRSRLLEAKVRDSKAPWHAASSDLRFATAVAGFTMLLKGSAHAGTLSFDEVFTMAYQSRGEDRGGYRLQFLDLVKAAKQIHDKAQAGEADDR